MTDPQPTPPRRRFSQTFYVLIVLVAATCFGVFVYREGEPYRKLAVEAAEVLQGLEAAQGTFYALDSKGTNRVEAPSEGHFHGWKVLAEQPMKAGELETLRGILTSAGTYGPDNYRCFEPGMGLRLQAGARTLDLVVCLACQKLVCHESPIIRNWNLSRSGCDRLESIYKAHVP